VVPEYLGTALTSLRPPAGLAMSDPAAVRAALARVLARWHVQVMATASAQDQNGIVVSGATARRLGLHMISDLRRAAGRLILGGSPECPDRPYCLPGLRKAYGLGFAGFLPFDTESQRVTALREGVVDVTVLDTTDGNLAAGDPVLLSDDRHLQPAENIVPVITSSAMARYGKRLGDAVNVVSAQLTSKALLFMDWRVEVAGNDVMAEARGWLERHRILSRPG
jgi:osmoprotectant transport system substrate-binding protein